jgi:glucose/arabinose dehydrogenase
MPSVVQTKAHRYRVETLVGDGVRTPWAIDWLPDGRALVTEKRGQLRLVEGGKLHPEPIRGTPQVLVHGQGGLMDVAVDPDHASNGWIYLAYTHGLPDSPQGRRRAMTRVVRGKLRDHQWVDEQVLFEAKPEHYLPGGVHFGCRIVFDRKGHLFFSIGERGEMRMAQDLTRPNGKVHRIHLDGSIPADNPFVDRPDAYPSIYSFGNRNPQGLAVHPATGELWATEHGPMGGDELNRIEPGRNYGWPVISYGINYNGRPITDKTEQEGMEQPVIQWTPSPALCGLDVYAGDAFDQWKNDLLVGALKFEEVKRVRIVAGAEPEQEVILKGRGRVRDVCAAPDGYVYVVLNDPDQVIRLVPEEREERE